MSAAPNLPRPVIRCANCLLMQFETRNGDCRRCRVALHPQPVPVSIIRKQRAARIGYSKIDEGMALAVRALRQAHGLSQYHLANRFGSTRPWISKVETLHTLPKLPSINRLAVALDVTPSQLVGFAEVIAEHL